MVFLKILSCLARPVNFCLLYLKSRRLFKSHLFDKLMVINGSYPGGDFCRAATIAWGVLHKDNKAIHNFHNSFSKYHYHDFFYEIIFDCFMSKYTRDFVSVSKSCANSLALRKPIANRHQGQYIYNGMSLKLLHNNPFGDIRKELNISDTTQICLMLGVYEPRKGHAFLFRAFDSLNKLSPDVHLIVCGDGDAVQLNQVDALRKEIAPKANIHLLPFRLDALELIRQSDIILVPSQSYESFGYVALEAMTQKKPVVVTNVGGLPEVVKHNNSGIVVNSLNPEIFSSEVLSLLKNASLRKEFGENGYRRYQELFTADIMAKSYHRLLTQGVLI